MSEIDDIKARLKARKPKPPREKYLHSGSTLLNLICTDNTEWGYKRGHYYLLAGSSGAGKTMFGHAALAEASIDRDLDDYDLYFDNAEDGALMDLSRFFGKRLAQRLKPPTRGISTSIEEFYFNLDDLSQKGKPYIYLLDSMDALTSEEEVDKLRERKKAWGTSKKVSGSYGDSKAKKNSSGLRPIIPYLRDSKSLLLIIAQSRSNFDPMSYEKDTRSGGHALTFYATVELWFKKAGALKARAKGKEFKQGVRARITAKKNRESGKEWSVDVPIYWSLGIDDLGSMVDFLVEYKHWKRAEKGEKVTADDLGFTGTKSALIRLIEEQDRLEEVKSLVSGVWGEIRQACEVERKSRYE